MKHKALPVVPAALASVFFFGSMAMATQDDEAFGPAASPVDPYHPAKEAAAEKAYGGQVIVHLSSMPEGLNRVVENSASANWMLYELHDRLVLQNWEYFNYEPSLCESWDTEDQIILLPEAAAGFTQAKQIGTGDKARHVLFGTVEAGEQGYTITSKSKGNPLGSGTSIVVPKAAVSSVEMGTVFTFYLPGNVKWHDGHLFDAQDVLFTFNAYSNEHVDCDETRMYYQKILTCEAPDDGTVRFFYAEQYFKALEVPGDMCILPRHLYDLTDPDRPRSFQSEGRPCNEASPRISHGGARDR